MCKHDSVELVERNGVADWQCNYCGGFNMKEDTPIGVDLLGLPPMDEQAWQAWGIRTAKSFARSRIGLHNWRDYPRIVEYMEQEKMAT